MSKKLVIVESPAKARMIGGFLGGDFTVKASMGHIRDLPKTGMGIDIANNFQPEYLVDSEKSKLVAELRKDAKAAEEIILATDEDREGEAIAWHLLAALGVNPAKQKVCRIAFHEITKTAIQEALANPRQIDSALVDAQQARRVVDRLVGYELSPVLWRKVRTGLSAGRVQSVAVRIVVEREREIRAFRPEEYWTVEADLATPRGEAFTANLTQVAGEKMDVRTGAAAEKIEMSLRGASWQVADLEEKEVRRNPLPPFTTSTLQQEASRKLGFAVKKTMMLAQRLYEGAYGEGLITYMRTDSVNLAASAVEAARAEIRHRFGAEYVPSSARSFKTKSKGAQEAHEAIRPTDPRRDPASLRNQKIDPDALRLYELIWQRLLACQMEQAVLTQTGANIAAGDCVFRATGQVVKFPGFLRAYQEGKDEDSLDDGDRLLPALAIGEILDLKQLRPEQHFTKPPARYSEATLVKRLEELGIGRPSTYAPTISTIQARGYVERDGRQLRPTDTGEVVTDFLVRHFPVIAEYSFTAAMEESLDAIADGSRQWTAVIREFYEPFHETVTAGAEISRAEATQARELGRDPATGKPIFAKLARFGAVVQLGETESEEKPKFASLLKGQSIQSISLEEALRLLQLPRKLGQTADGEEVRTSQGRFGPYVQAGKTFVSISEDELFSLELHEALQKIADKREQVANRLIADWPEAGIQILNGRFGPYITNGSKNAKIPKDTDPKSIDLETAQKLIAEAPEKKGGWGRKKAAGAKSPAASKKPAAKKAPAKKKTATKKKAAPKKKKAE